MPEPDTPRSAEHADATGSWRAGPSAGGSGADPPTVRSGPQEAGSSLHRRNVIQAMPGIGERLGTFRLVESIGVGGMGAVFLAQDHALDRSVALKILPPEQSGDVEVVQRFYQEAKAAARLDHENIARVYTIGGDGSYHFIAFEYIEGTTLRLRVEQSGPISVAETINYTLQIAGALVHAAERGVVHRDIKPSNIIITPQGRAKLVDMGLARRFERGSDDGLTQSGMTLGTFDYISPEQARDPRDVDVRSDLYSLGCTMFHMLTGRPPFPDGTVLQKLLQHQEDPAPDVRSMNPAVPADLAAILLKLMAKERDRRYQTPEQLVRDLLTLAGSLGLRSISPEGLVWMSAAKLPTWERHLSWAVPTVALALVVLGLVYWSQPTEVGDRTAGDRAIPDPPPGRVESPRPRSTTNRAAARPDPAKPTDTEAPTPISSPESKPREILIRTGDDLAAQLASAPSGSTLTIAEEGPFDVRPTLANSKLKSPRTLTVRAAVGVRPVVRLAKASASSAIGDASIFRFGADRIELEGLEFVLDPSGREANVAAISAESTELRIRRCLFRRSGNRDEGRGRLAAISLTASRSSVAGGDRPPPVVIEECHFDGGQAGILSSATTDLLVRDCTMGGNQPAIGFTNGSGTPSINATVVLRHVSILAGDGPVLQFEKTRAHVRIDDSVIAAPRGRDGTLVAIDDPQLLDWYGRGNLYGKLGTYLRPTRKDLAEKLIVTYDEWADDERAARESESIPTGSAVWRLPDPSAALARRDPSAGFVVNGSERPGPNTGARRGPVSVIGVGDPTLVADNDTPSTTPFPKTTEPVRPDSSSKSPPTKADTTIAQAPKSEVTTPARASETGDMPPATNPAATQDMERAGMNDPVETRPAVSTTPSPSKTTETSKATENSKATETSPPDRPATDASTAGKVAEVIHTSRDFVDAMRRLGAGTGSRKLTIASDADIDLSTCDFSGKGRWILQAEKGHSRPRLRFRPAAGEARTSAILPALFRVQTGALELLGIDIILAQNEAPTGGRWAAFCVWSGTELSLSNCTVTMQGDGSRGSVVAVGAGEIEPEAGLAGVEGSAASIRISDCIIRAGGDFLDTAPGRRLDLVVTNAVFAVGRAIVHGHGIAKGEMPETLKVTMRQVSARASGGLVFLESAAGEPDLPVADVLVRETVLATTNRSDPLIRVDGQESVDSLRDRIQWEGHAVAYHDIQTYRLDQSSQPGSIPVRFERQSWDLAVGPRETEPIHEDARFERPWTSNRHIWTATRDDFRLANDSPAQSAGPNLNSIPDPPSQDAIDREPDRAAP
jgi:eukaryotic-like serine/threonine-protein kinase